MKELRLDERVLNEEMKGQASKYGFCLLLVGKLKTIFEELKVEKDRTYGRLYFKAKEQKSTSTGRYLSDDMAKAWVEKHPQYIKACLACIKAKDNVDTIYSCIKSFEQRKDLAQSISSNLRNEK